MRSYQLAFVMFFIGINTLLAVTVGYNKETNSIEFVNEILVDDASCHGKKGVVVYNPPSPFDHVTFIITLPSHVSLNKPFTVDYTIKTTKYCAIPLWADLVPDPVQLQMQGLSLIDYTTPTLGTFDPTTDSATHNGGKGSWRFEHGLPGNSVQHFTVTLIAKSPGIKQYSMFIATNPPSTIGPCDLVVSND